MDYGLSRLYGLWYAFPCEPTWWTEKGMGFQGVWVIKAMDYEGVDCTLLLKIGIESLLSPDR